MCRSATTPQTVLLVLTLTCAVLHPTASRSMNPWGAVEQKNAPLAVENEPDASLRDNSRNKRSTDWASLPDVEKVKMTTLWEAVWQRNVSLVSKILANGANVNQKLVGDQWTVLHDVVSSPENLQLAALLLRNGASVNARNSDNKTPLFEASYYGNDKMVALLLKNGADQSIKCNSTWCIASGARSPLEVATMWCHTKVVALLSSTSQLETPPQGSPLGSPQELPPQRLPQRPPPGLPPGLPQGWQERLQEVWQARGQQAAPRRPFGFPWGMNSG